jgi:hypothetical protein
MNITLGNLVFPLSDFANSLREVADPAHELLGMLLFSDIYYELNPIYQKIFPDGYIVNDFIPIDPEELLLEDQLSFPALALWRVENKTSDFSISRKQLVTQWAGQYLYGELSLDDEIRLIGLSNSISARINTVLEVLKSDGYQNGISQIDQLGFSKINNVEVKKDTLKFNNDNRLIRFPVVNFTFQTVEILDYYNEIVNPLHEIDLLINDGDGYNIIDGYFIL